MMTKFFVSVILLFFATNSAFAKGNNMNNEKPQITLEQKIVDNMRSYLDEHNMHVNYILSKSGEIFHKNSVGYYDKEKDTKLELSHSMPVASMTKIYTATSILLLQDRGLLSVDDKLSKFIPNGSDIWPNGKMPSWANKVSLHNLMTHSDGIADYLSYIKLDRNKPLRELLKDVVAYQVSKPLNFEPGTDVKYGHSGFMLLGFVIEKASKKSYSDFIKEEFVDKLGLKNTYIMKMEKVFDYLDGNLIDKYPKQYFAVPSKDEEMSPNTRLQAAYTVLKPVAVSFSDVGLVSNVEDMIKFQDALHHGKILSKESYNQMITPYYEVDIDTGDAKSYYGYGLYISRMPGKIKYYHHEGKSSGMRSDAGYIPSLDMSMAFLSNIVLLTNPNRYDREKEDAHPDAYKDIIDLRDYMLKTVVAHKIEKEMEQHKESAE